MDASGAALGYSTYLGGDGNDHGDGIAVDGADSAYVTGQTDAADFPTTAGAFDRTLGGDADVFVTKFDASGGALGYSTYLGGSDAEGFYNGDIAVGAAGDAYITGFTISTDFPTPRRFRHDSRRAQRRLHHEARRERRRPRLLHLLGRKQPRLWLRHRGRRRWKRLRDRGYTLDGLPDQYRRLRSDLQRRRRCFRDEARPRRPATPAASTSTSTSTSTPAPPPPPPPPPPRHRHRLHRHLRRPLHRLRLPFAVVSRGHRAAPRSREAEDPATALLGWQNPPHSLEPLAARPCDQDHRHDRARSGARASKSTWSSVGLVPEPKRRVRAAQGLRVFALATSTLVLAGSTGHAGANAATSLAGPAALKHARAAGIDIASVVETVQHHVAPSMRDRSVLVASDRLYRAEFSRRGVTLSLRGSRFGLETMTVRRSGRSLAVAPSGWTGRLNYAERSLLPGLKERITAVTGAWSGTSCSRGRRRGRATSGSTPVSRRVLRRIVAAEPGAGPSVVTASFASARWSSETPQVASSTVRCRVRPRTTCPWRFQLRPRGSGLPGRDRPGDQSRVSGLQSRSRAATYLSANRSECRVRRFDLLRRLAGRPSHDQQRRHLRRARKPGRSRPRSDRNPDFGPLVPGIQADRCLRRLELSRRLGGSSLHIRTTSTASRVSQAGVVLDPNGIPIATTGNEQHAPRVTFGGSNFFVAWQDSSGAENDVYGARVSPGGDRPRPGRNTDLDRSGQPSRPKCRLGRQQLPRGLAGRAFRHLTGRLRRTR